MKTLRSRRITAMVFAVTFTFSLSGYTKVGEKPLENELTKASKIPQSKPATVLPPKMVETIREPAEDKPDESNVASKKETTNNRSEKPAANLSQSNKAKRVRGVSLGLQTGYALESFSGSPVGVEGDSVQPPVLTLKFGFNPRYSTLFQPIVNVAASALPGSGIALYLEAGALLDWPGFHLSGGLEGSMTVEGGEYADTLFDNSTKGGFLRGAVPLGRFYPSLEVRKRKVEKTLIARKEGIGTYTQHEDDFVIRPAVVIDFNPLKLWAAVTRYQVGAAAIGSEDFGVGLSPQRLTMYSLGVGYQFNPKILVWLKAHQIDGVRDETAHYYQVPQLYPDFMLAKNSLFLEAQWTF